MHIEVDTSRWDGGPSTHTFAHTKTRPEKRAHTTPFSRQHLVGVFEAALKAHHQRTNAPGFWDRIVGALGRTPRISLKGQYLSAAFAFTGRPLDEPLKSWVYYTVSIGDCAVLLKELREQTAV